MSITDRVATLAEPLVASHDLELVDVEHAGSTVRVVVDGNDGAAPHLDLLAQVSRELSRALDEDDPVPGRYTLEVSSPGLERALKRPDHFVRAVGSLVEVMLDGDPVGDGTRQLKGTLDSADEQGITVAGVTVGHEHVKKARTVFEWGPTPKKGGKKKQKQSPSSEKKRSAAR